MCTIVALLAQKRRKKRRPYLRYALLYIVLLDPFACPWLCSMCHHLLLAVILMPLAFVPCMFMSCRDDHSDPYVYHI